MTADLPENAPSDAPATGTDGKPSDVAEAGADCTPTSPKAAVEIGGRKGPDPTRYGDWEKNGRCIDF
jgi:hypothetical protein